MRFSCQRIEMNVFYPHVFTIFLKVKGGGVVKVEVN